MKKHKRILTQNGLIISLVCCLICSISVGCKRSVGPLNEQIMLAESLVWTSPDSSMTILESIDVDSLPYGDQMYWQLEYEHASSRLGLPMSPDTIMETVIQYFKNENLPDFLAKAYYVQAAEYYTLTEYFESMCSAKEAESRLEFLSDTLPYAALTYFLEGAIAETDGLSHIANASYRKGLPYVEKLGDKRRLACFYRDIARTDDYQNTSWSNYFKAEQLAMEIQDTMLYYDILMQKEWQRDTLDSVLIYEIGAFLADSMDLYRYSCYAAEYLLRHGNIAEAEKYLCLFARDTVCHTVVAENYQYYKSLFEYHLGEESHAYQRIEALYLGLREKIEQDAVSRAYTISRMYDVEQEKNKNLQLDIDKRRLWLLVCALGALAVLFISLLGFFYGRERNLRLKKEMEGEIDRMRAEQAENEVRIRRKALQKMLQQRIMLTKQLHLSIGKLDNMPKGVKKMIDDLSISDKKSWDMFVVEFNELFGNILAEMKEEYPLLTEQDEQYIALALLGLDNNEIAVLLQMNTQSVWNRRQRIRNHLDIDNQTLDDMLKEWQKKIKYS